MRASFVVDFDTREDPAVLFERLADAWRARAPFPDDRSIELVHLFDPDRHFIRPHPADLPPLPVDIEALNDRFVRGLEALRRARAWVRGEPFAPIDFEAQVRERADSARPWRCYAGNYHGTGADRHDFLRVMDILAAAAVDDLVYYRDPVAVDPEAAIRPIAMTDLPDVVPQMDGEATCTAYLIRLD